MAVWFLEDLLPAVSWTAVSLLATDPAASLSAVNGSSNLGCSGLMTNISELTDPSSDNLRRRLSRQKWMMMDLTRRRLWTQNGSSVPLELWG